ncbi:MAG: putative ATP-dependent DNA helicase PIF1 [Streblomastix strix]|uniref:Putative ATP-dependent DNA helicase PIF1 n=1 Tax=Streblomastix strix TaxID=222440 RepID=A0A5J4VXZ4_9EUKA|nr:MAG: putative ATP-dependent DNA helicase PIF1 [Streblomastix strix]
MEDNNPYAVSLRSMRNKLDEENEAAQNEGRAIQDLQLYFIKKRTGLTEKVYSLLSADEIAAVCAPTDEGEFKRHHTFHFQSMDGQNIQALQIQQEIVWFSLYYSLKELGVGVAMIKRKSQIISKLINKYLIYAALSVVSSRLNWVKIHQYTLRVKTYKGLRDYINRLMIQEGVLSGERFVLQIKEFVLLDLLIIFTSNPRWDEIISIIGDDSPANHPNIVSKILIIMQQELLDDIVKHHILGKVSCYCYGIEFQKRGLPHAHILITFQQEDKLNTTNKIDNIISAEIPSIEQDSELQNAVLKHMVHRECHEGSECWENSECKKRISKAIL